MSREVWVELDEAGEPCRIFKTHKAAAIAEVAGRQVDQWPRAWAVEQIRNRVIARADSACDRCGKVLTKDSGEMHETLPKGKGGEVSLDNCEWLCHECHQGKDGAHGNRRLRFGEGVENESLRTRDVRT